jgi:hypothetical protein
MTTIDDNAVSETSAAALPGDLESAITLIHSLRIENADLKRMAEELKEQNRILKAREYGRRSEKRTTEDLRRATLFNEAKMYATSHEGSEAVETVRISKTVYTRKKRGRTQISPKLARNEVLVDLGEVDKSAVPEGFELKRIGEGTAEQVHEIPQKYVVIRTVRPKYIVKRIRGSGSPAQGSPGRIMIAPVPARILPRRIATPSLLA